MTHPRDKNNFFRPEDFDGCPSTRFVANKANAILREYLKECTVVYGEKYGPDSDAFYGWRMSRRLPDTHRAYLIGVERIGDE